MTPGPITICVAGVLAVVNGLAALLVSTWAGKTSRPALWALAGGLALALADVGAWLAGGEEWLLLSVGALSGAWLVFAAMRSGALEWAARQAAQPRGQAVLLLVVGIGLSIWGLCALDNNLNNELLDTETQLEMMVAAIELRPASQEAQTDAGRPVPLFLPDAGDDTASFSEESYMRRRHLDQHIIQTGPVDLGYNCHGWVFAGGKFWVRGASVPKILEDNGYKAVSRPRPGDVAIFVDKKGEVMHTALVRGRGASGAILLESKWGKLGRYIHTADRHLYSGHTITYYHTARGSHLLHGLAGGELTSIDEDEVDETE